MPQTIHFPSGATDYHFNESIKNLNAVVGDKNLVMVTDKNLFHHYKTFFENYKTIVISAGEKNKTWEMAKQITEDFIKHEVDKTYLIIGVGGGMIMDITGFVAAIYMRGLEAAFIPTSLLAMVDAAIGGKNGVNITVYKNMVGTVRQPKFILYDTDFLLTLPAEEWCNGFAEIIKYGCIFDKGILDELHTNNIDFYKKNKPALATLIEKCASIKNKTVQDDEQEKCSRKLLNFGHTVGHAIENANKLPHGAAISIGMMIASELSEKQEGLDRDEMNFIKGILEKYQLPVKFNFDINQVMQTLKMDKKRTIDGIDFILLEKLGTATIRRTTFEEIEQALVSYSNTSI